MTLRERRSHAHLNADVRAHMHWLTWTITVAALTFPTICEAQTSYTNSACEYTIIFPNTTITKEDEFNARTEFEAIPFMSAKCFRCPQACRYRQSLEKEILSGLLDQFELKDYVLTSEPEPKNGFSISGVTTKENSLTRIEARVLFGENSILILGTVQPVSVDQSIANSFLQSPRRKTNAP
jgi:hypothetical protein